MSTLLGVLPVVNSKVTPCRMTLYVKEGFHYFRSFCIVSTRFVYVCVDKRKSFISLLFHLLLHTGLSNVCRRIWVVFNVDGEIWVDLVHIQVNFKWYSIYPMMVEY